MTYDGARRGKKARARPMKAPTCPREGIRAVGDAFEAHPPAWTRSRCMFGPRRRPSRRPRPRFRCQLLPYGVTAPTVSSRWLLGGPGDVRRLRARARQLVVRSWQRWAASTAFTAPGRRGRHRPALAFVHKSSNRVRRFDQHRVDPCAAHTGPWIKRMRLRRDKCIGRADPTAISVRGGW